MTNLRRYLEFWEWLKAESQMEVNALCDQIVEDIDTRVKCANAKKVETEPQTMYYPQVETERRRR